MPDMFTEQEEREILSDPSTRRLVFDVLKLAESRDILDSSRDVALAAKILYSRFDRMTSRASLPAQLTLYRRVGTRTAGPDYGRTTLNAANIMGGDDVDA